MDGELQAGDSPNPQQDLLSFPGLSSPQPVAPRWPSGARSSPGAQLCSSCTRTLVSPCSCPGRDGMLGMSLQHLSEGRHSRTPSSCMRLQTGGSSLVPSHLQDLQPPQSTESPILDAADLVLVQLPEGEREKKGELLGQPRQRAISAPDLLLPAATGPNPKLPHAQHCQDSQVLEVGGSTECFPGDGLDEVLTQVPAEERGRKANGQCLQSVMSRGGRASTGRGTPRHSVISRGLLTN